MAFTYQPRPETKWAKRAKGNIFDGFIKDGFTTYAPRKGENQIRILPPTWKNPEHYGFDIWAHYGVGPNNGSVLCIYRMKAEKCPICAAQARAVEAGNEQGAKELKPTRRVLVWIIDRKEELEKGEKTVPLLWAMPQTLDQEISKVCRDRETGALFMIDDPNQGYDIYFDKEGEKLQTKYTAPTVSRRSSDVDARYLDYITKNPIHTTLEWRDFKEVQAIFEGLGNDEEEAQAQAPQPTQQQTAVYTPPPAQPTQMPGPPPAQAPVVPFIPQWIPGVLCSVCGQGQYTTISGGHTCAGGHENAPPQPPPQPASSTPPPPQPPAGNGSAIPNQPAPAEKPSRAAGLRSQFTTGK